MKTLNTPKSQQGFSLLEISLAMMMVVGLTVAVYQIMEYRAWMEQAKTVAEQIRTINEAVSTYAGNNSEILSDKNLSLDCEVVPYGVVDEGADAGTVSLATPATQMCSKDFGSGANKVTVANVMQPTLNELKQLQLLSNSSSYQPIFNTQKRVVYKDSNNVNAFLPAGYSVLIKRVCINNPKATPSSPRYCDNPNPGYYDIQTLVFNNQPYDDKSIKYNGMTNMLYTAFRAAGTDALLSADGITKTIDPNNNNTDITANYPLIPQASDGQSFIDNPLKNAAGVGVKNILAMRGGYSSSVRTNTLRQDGLTPMTGPLNLGNNDIVGANNISVTGNIDAPNGTITAQNIIATNQFTANSINTSSVTSSGNFNGFNFMALNNITANNGIKAGKCADTLNEGDIIACNDLIAKNNIKATGSIKTAGAISADSLTSGNFPAGNGVSMDSNGDVSASGVISAAKKNEKRFFSIRQSSL